MCVFIFHFFCVLLYDIHFHNNNDGDDDDDDDDDDDENCNRLINFIKHSRKQFIIMRLIGLRFSARLDYYIGGRIRIS